VPKAKAHPTRAGKRVRVAFQGERGAFSEEAARRILGERIEPCPQREFDEIFTSVIRDEADCAVVPMENTLAGSVIKNYDLLADNDLEIIGEVILRVAHNLIAPKGATVESLRKIYSHPVALAQCEDYLRKLRLHQPGLEILPHYDTAGSVKLVMENGRRDEAAIASRIAARIYHAQILAESIESNPQNFTRFFIMARPDRRGSVPLKARSRELKTSIVFRTTNKPGALFHALEAFAKGKIDLTKIESRPIVGRPWEYSFYLDFIGDRNTPAARKALASLTMVAESLRIFGSYPRAE
jgi:prephenate dehydratase